MNYAPKEPSTLRLLRLPIVVGLMFISLGVSYIYRDELVAMMAEERAKMYAQHPEAERLFKEQKEKMRRIH